MKYSFSVIKNKKVLLILIIIIILFTKIVITFRNNEPFTKKDYHKIHMNLLSALERIQMVLNIGQLLEHYLALLEKEK